MDREIAILDQSRNSLDNTYTLFESGRILHIYDRHIYPGGQNLSEELKAEDLQENIKQLILANTEIEDLDLAKNLLKIGH